MQSRPPRVLMPNSVHEALSMAAREPDAVYWAGGMAFKQQSGHGAVMKLPGTLIVLSRIEELARVLRTERTLDIGSMTNLERIAEIGRGFLPPGMQEAIASTAVRPVRCMISIGGHIAEKKKLGYLLPLLQLLDAKVEVRFLRTRRGRVLSIPGNRKIPIAGFHDAASGLPHEALITRVSIPLHIWNAGQFIKVYPGGRDNPPFIFCGAARVEKKVLMEVRLAFTDAQTGIFRDTELEASMAGRGLPLSNKDLQQLSNAVSRITANWIQPFNKAAAWDAVCGFFSRIIL
ncbi:MAG: hypothetical protein B0D92_05815 [Spirochaeta sp. LUC14_002_19_P3]|nr:MAG: hypothetical protein B0D92_05815 [Spirochaeta sp. LUC14_002_19_P3]